MSGRGPVLSRRAEIVLGVAAFVGGSLLIRHAYDGRGHELPFWARPFSWW